MVVPLQRAVGSLRAAGCGLRTVRVAGTGLHFARLATALPYLLDAAPTRALGGGRHQRVPQRKLDEGEVLPVP